LSRKVSGLPRSWSAPDMWIYNVLATHPVVTATLTFTMMLVTYPYASLPVAAVIAAVSALRRRSCMPWSCRLCRAGRG
jgi:hypothetical protein